MKKFFLTILVLISLSPIGFTQTQTFYVKSFQTDINYSSSEDSNYIVRNTSANLNKLVLFIGGTGSSPKSYSLFCQYPASLGFDVISLCYPNDIPAASQTGSSDNLAFDKFRQEVCFGTPQSSAVAVDTFNSIYTRTLKLIQYLDLTYPSQNWGQYLISSSALDWSRIIVGGHSQGSGHAAYLAKYYEVERVLMFSGPNDYSSYFSNSANWLRQAGLTPVQKYFALLHLQDEVVPFSDQYTDLQGLGMLNGDDTTLVDNLTSPYFNSHCLYTDLTPFFAGQYHNSTVGGNALLPSVWQYMLTASVATGLYNPLDETRTVTVYPNPSSSIFTIGIPEAAKSGTLNIFNSYGQLISTKENTQATLLTIDLSLYPKGIYFIMVDGWIGKAIKE